jgi:hypothetical protein
MKSLTADEARDLLHHCLEEGELIETKHFREMLAKRDLTMGDARTVLTWGRIYNPPKQDAAGEWTYRIEGFQTDRRWLAIVFCFKSPDCASLITIFPKKRSP